MPALVAGIHVLLLLHKDVDGRDKPGHDASKCFVASLLAMTNYYRAQPFAPNFKPTCS